MTATPVRPNAGPDAPSEVTVVSAGPPDLESLLWDEHSALFWSQRIGRYVARMRAHVDAYAIAAAVVSGITGAAVWTTVSSWTGIWPQLLVTAIAVGASILALVPKQLNYGDAADKAAGLSEKYLHVLHQLRSARLALAASEKCGPQMAADAIAKFEVRAAKESLRPYPQKLQREKEREVAKLMVGQDNLGRPALVARPGAVSYDGARARRVEATTG
jgi:hypothetical protein